MRPWGAPVITISASTWEYVLTRSYNLYSLAGFSRRKIESISTVTQKEKGGLAQHSYCPNLQTIIKINLSIITVSISFPLLRYIIAMYPAYIPLYPKKTLSPKPPTVKSI